jgi:D-alanyl-lipoteichoic acid acyltransferase DltB (MBOAT superfamily)
MLFNSDVFAVFFALFFPLYLLVRRDVARRNVLLILGSYVFYGWWDSRFLILVAISTSVDYIAALGAAGKEVRPADKMKSVGFLLAVTVGSLAFVSLENAWLLLLVILGIGAAALWLRVIAAAPPEKARRYWLYLSLFTNLGILAFFKYFNFFVDSASDGLAAMGLEVHRPTLTIILPVGLSFYTFQAISRTIDSYRGVYEPRYSIINYAAYHAFFPQLVAGPIERAGHLMPQFESVRPLNRDLFTSGALLFVWGLYQKMVIADNVAPVANAVFANPEQQSAGAAVAGVLAFTFQIYCDFCGYSNMARGVARCLGFELVPNFKMPYFSRSPAEFWQRWHVSLSSWLRDYLYIPLGGNRGGPARTYRNLMLTMLLGGLWHGAAWTFVAWGAFHGGIQVVYRALRIDALIARYPFASPVGLPVHLIAWAVTMVLVMIGWVLFRAESFGDAWALLGATMGTEGYSVQTFWPVVAYALPLVLVEIYQRATDRQEVLTVGPLLLRYTAAASVLLTLLVFSAPSSQEFIYFDF